MITIYDQQYKQCRTMQTNKIQIQHYVTQQITGINNCLTVHTPEHGVVRTKSLATCMHVLDNYAYS